MDRRFDSIRYASSTDKKKEVKRKEKVRFSGSSCSQRNNVNEITIGGLTNDEFAVMEKMINGGCHVMVKKGALVHSDSFERPPSPVQDEDMYPFWKTNEGYAEQLELFDFREDDEQKKPLSDLTSSPSFMIQSLCGYNYTKEFYKQTAERLESFGFSCMRSQRGDDGKFWEVWYLGGAYSVEGELKKHIEKKEKEGEEKKNKVQKIISYLCRNVSFGTLDMCVQRAAMVMD